MKLLGLTGGMGMGKSSSADFLRQAKLPVLDTDGLARAMVAPGQPALAEIRSIFGDGILDEVGRLRRRELAARVFADVEARRQLERILHPRIRAAWQQAADNWRQQGQRAGVVVIPLLFETGAESEFDVIICVACSVSEQTRRLEERGWSAEQTVQRIQAQWPIERKMELAHFVLWNDGERTVLAEQIQNVLRCLELV